MDVSDMEAAHEKGTSGCEEGYLPDGGWRRFVRAGRISLRTCTRSRSIRSLGHSALPCPHPNIGDIIAARRLVRPSHVAWCAPGVAADTLMQTLTQEDGGLVLQHCAAVDAKLVFPKPPRLLIPTVVFRRTL